MSSQSRSALILRLCKERNGEKKDEKGGSSSTSKWEIVSKKHDSLHDSISTVSLQNTKQIDVPPEVTDEVKATYYSGRLNTSFIMYSIF